MSNNSSPSSIPTPSSTVSSITSTNQSVQQGSRMSGNQLSVTDMPIVGTKGAPKKFTGKASEVNQFVRHLERLFGKYNVTTGKEKVESVTQYTSSQCRRFMEALKSYQDGDWDAFSKDLKKYYEADKETRRYKVRDLEKYVLKSRAKKGFSGLAAWMKYNRGFISIAGWLEKKKKISESEKNIYYWKGIPRRFRDRIEVRLMSHDPDHDLNTPFAMADIIKSCEALLKRDRFDNDRLPSDSEDSDSEESDSESEDSEEESSSDEGLIPIVKKRKPAHKKKASRTKKTKSVKFKVEQDSESESSSSDEESGKPQSGKSTPTKNKISQSPTDQEFEQLIKQLNNMSVNDSDYASVYFKAYKINPIIRELVLTPNQQRSRANTPPPRPRERSFERDIPPHLARSGESMGSRPPLICYGCGKQGHTMTACLEIQDLAQKGIIKQGATGRWTFADGRPIIRNYAGEPLTQCVQRVTATQNNLVTVEDEEDQELSDEEEVYAVQHEFPEYLYDYSDQESAYADVYPAEQSQKTTRRARQDRMDTAGPSRKESGARTTKNSSKPFEKEIPKPR